MIRNIILVFCIPMILLISCIDGEEKMTHIRENSPFTYNAKGKIKSTIVYFYPNNDTSGKYEVATYTAYDEEGRAIIVNDTLAATDNIIARHLEYSNNKVSGWNTMNKRGDISSKAEITWESKNKYSTTVVNNHNVTVYQNTVDLNPDYSLKAICETFFDSSEVMYCACRTYQYDETRKVSNCTYKKGLHEGITSQFTVNDIDNRGNPILLTESGGNGTINRKIRILYDYYE
jgi:hypothetical protein